MKTFNPNNNNLGGKRTIENHKNNHILSVLNATPLVNSLKFPHPHVNGNQRNKKKNIEVDDYYREVYETQKKILNMKHGYVNHSKPKTFHLRNSISKQLIFEKNIILHDHLRNITHLDKSLKMISKKSEKNIESIKNLGSNNNNNNISSNKSILLNKNIKTKNKSIDLASTGNLFENYNPFAVNNKYYDSSDGIIAENENIIDDFQDKIDSFKNDNENLNKKTLKIGNILEEEGNYEIKNYDYDLLKKEIFESIVKCKAYDKQDVIEIQKKIINKYHVLEKEKIELIFQEIFHYFFK